MGATAVIKVELREGSITLLHQPLTNIARMSVPNFCPPRQISPALVSHEKINVGSINIDGIDDSSSWGLTKIVKENQLKVNT